MTTLAGSGAGLAEAFATYRQSLLAHARSIVKNHADAEDVVQDAFERAWRARDRFDGSDAAPWLLTITKHRALDALRARTGRVLSAPETAVNYDGADTLVERIERARSIAKAVRTLQPHYRTAFGLHDIEGYSNRELAAHLELPYHTVR